MDKTKKITIGLYALSIFLIFGISYAYFSLNIIGNDDAKLSVITSGTLELTYVDNDEITLDNIIPGDSIQKEITVENTGTLDTMYNIIWQELNNEFLRNELVISATCERINSEGTIDGTCNNIEEKPVARLSIPQKISIEAGITHKYTVTIKFIDTGKNQNYNKGKSFSGKLGIEEYIDNTPEATYCTFDGELTLGATYVNGQYTYMYGGQYGGEGWEGIEDGEGWGVTLTDKDSTNPVTSKVCTYINDKPVISMSFMFYGSSASSIDLSKVNTSNVANMSGIFFESQATTVDVSSFDTSNVTDMSGMFASSAVTTIDLSNFNTSKVTNMNSMFYSSQATVLDLSSFDTRNVTNMGYMFMSSQATILDLSNFNTCNVTNMEAMFGDSQATILDLNSFDTRNVTNMGAMFYNSQATTVDLSSFNTSKVTDMLSMFYDSRATSIDVSNFDTSKVTDMSNMFNNIKVTSIDLSNFDTSNVTNMDGMFSGSVNLKTIYASNKFNINAVTSSNYMFTNCNSLVGGSGTTYDSTKVDKTYARIDGGTSSPGYFTAK